MIDPTDDDLPTLRPLSDEGPVFRLSDGTLVACLLYTDAPEDRKLMCWSTLDQDRMVIQFCDETPLTGEEINPPMTIKKLENGWVEVTVHTVDQNTPEGSI